MHHHTTEFVQERNTLYPGIVSYALGADENIAMYRIVGVREGDYIGVVIVVEVFHIDVAQVFVGAKNVIDLYKRLVFGSCYCQKPVAQSGWVGQIERNVFEMERNGRIGRVSGQVRKSHLKK